MGLLFLASAGFYIVFIVLSSSSIDWRGSYTWSTVDNSIAVGHDYFLWRNDGSCHLYFEFGGHVYRDENETENLTLAGIDGQKSVCLDPGLAPPPGMCVVYSFGLSDDRSFESAMAEYGCDVYAFDPSFQFSNMPNNSQRINYFDIGLGTMNTKNDSRGWKMATLTSIRKYLLHSYRPIDYLKIDIEGEEWHVLDHMLQDGRSLRFIKQIGIEVHLLDSYRLHYYRNLTQRLEASGYVRFFSRQNRWKTNAYELAWFNVNYSSKSQVAIRADGRKEDDMMVNYKFPPIV
ncbi:probable methyltransferase-like protein 24 [Daphnia carinata]|uniref:probable methyltransferase-like protein 24 n=1 Tax=Daphnia carinata TaxID=120202 RepID=UPI0025799F98|nr:probable methyltransferase-like protein 24 [Daphnia carinata]